MSHDQLVDLIASVPEVVEVREVDDELEAEQRPEPCAYPLFAGNSEEPPEFCDADSEPGTERCKAHTGGRR